LTLWLSQKTFKLKLKDFKKISIVISCILLGIVLRGIIIIPTNYYYAIPIWMGWTPEKAMEMLPWWIIFLVNAIQGILEVVIAWMLVFKFRLRRFASWK